MAATVTGTDRLIDATMGGGPGSRDGNGFHKNGGGGAEDGHPLKFSPARYRIGVWVAISSILMLFVALSSSYIVRSASGDDWRPIVMPKVLWFSTAVILVSSFTMEVSRRSLKAFNDAGYGRWLAITLILGLGFLFSQLLAWRQLVRQGVYVASNPHSSFFYLFTAAHGAHLMGGLAALAYLSLRHRAPHDNELAVAKAQAAADAVTLYWHFMDFL